MQFRTKIILGIAGTGLGLSISLEIINHHNGTLDFISKPNVGTEFFFELFIN